MLSWRTVAAGEPALGPARYPLARCTFCGSAATLGAPPDRTLYETGAYRPRPPRLGGPLAVLLDCFDRQRLALIRAAAPPPARLLDAGAGRGRFLLAAARAGYDAVGLEPSARGARTAAGRGAAIVRGSIEEASFADGSFDAITLWHVLEHLDDPAAALEHLSRWLQGSGTILVGVPNLASLQARIGGDRWYHLDVPRHRVHFTAVGLHRLLGDHGFEVLDTHHLLLEHNPFGMWQSLVNRITRRPSYLYNLLKHNAPVLSRDLAVTLAASPLVVPAALAELAAGMLGRGGTIAVLARKRQLA